MPFPWMDDPTGTRWRIDECAVRVMRVNTGMRFPEAFVEHVAAGSPFATLWPGHANSHHGDVHNVSEGAAGAGHEAAAVAADTRGAGTGGSMVDGASVDTAGVKDTEGAIRARNGKRMLCRKGRGNRRKIEGLSIALKALARSRFSMWETSPTSRSPLESRWDRRIMLS